MNAQEALVEARARIIWGEPAASVRYFLTLNGMPSAEVDAKIKEFNAERNHWIRRNSLRNVAIGAVIICVAGVLILLLLTHPSKLFPYKHAHAMYALVILGLCGIWKVVGGLFYFIRPEAEERSVTDISM